MEHEQLDMLPSGKRLQNYEKIQHFIAGWIPNFYGHFKSYVRLPEGTKWVGPFHRPSMKLQTTCGGQTLAIGYRRGDSECFDLGKYGNASPHLKLKGFLHEQL